MEYDPVIVVGSGRCGTSTVARILHNELGICMGPPEQDIGQALRGSERGGYEDAAFVDTNRALLCGNCTLPEWSESMNKLIQTKVHQPWGFKDPHGSRLLWMFLVMFENPKIIWCKRDRELVVKSIVKTFTGRDGAQVYDKKQAGIHCDITNLCLWRTLRGRQHLVIDYGAGYVSEVDIKDKVLNYLEKR